MTDSPGSNAPDRPRVRPAWITVALAADVLLILLFAATGRQTHESGPGLAGVFLTAAPFLAAWLIGTLATRPRRTWARVWPAGVVVWLVTVAGGLLLRVLTGDTAAPSFQVVTAVTLGALLLGRRLVTSLLMRRRGAARS